MSSYLSNLLTTTTSRYNSLRRTLLSSEDDGDTPDDTHICRVLRAYYTEKNRPLPGWLPPDPNARRAVTPSGQHPQQQSAGSYFAGARNPYGAGSGATPGGGGLSDLWDPPAATPAATTGPQSLRNVRRPTQQPAPQQSFGGQAQLAPQTQARPLPSQRTGSYQNAAPLAGAAPGAGNVARPGMEHSAPSTASVATSGSAQERLKARLWGGAAASGPPPPGQPQRGPSGNTYDASGRYGR